MLTKKVLIASAEANPFAKVGGLADVMGAITRELRKNGIDARLVIPKYSFINDKEFDIKNIVDAFPVQLGDKTIIAKVYYTEKPYPTYFIEGGDFFARDGVYTDKSGIPYPDEPYRFTFFSKAILESLPIIGFKPDVIHANDSHTALIPALLALKYRIHPFLGDIGTLFTIHNIGYQGIWDPSIIDAIGVGWDQFYPMGGFEFYGKVNFMKIGIVYADCVSTVSPTYALEIMSSSEYGYGLEGVLRARSNRVFGILNGVDYDEWSPEVDSFIPYRYSQENLENKEKNKRFIMKELKLDLRRAKSPLFGFIGRLVEQKGVELIYEVIPRIIEEGGNIVLLGTGDQRYCALLQGLQDQFPRRVSLNFKFDIRLSHLIEAACDFFLMPSKYEPCGLNQMYSLRYATIPIVRKTGGLADTILDLVEHPDEGYGFVFDDFSAPSFWKAIEEAFKLYEKKDLFNLVRKRAMAKDFSWGNSVLRYMELYERVYQWHNK